MLATVDVKRKHAGWQGKSKQVIPVASRVSYDFVSTGLKTHLFPQIS